MLGRLIAEINCINNETNTIATQTQTLLIDIATQNRIDVQAVISALFKRAHRNLLGFISYFLSQKTFNYWH